MDTALTDPWLTEIEIIFKVSCFCSRWGSVWSEWFVLVLVSNTSSLISAHILQHNFTFQSTVTISADCSCMCWFRSSLSFICQPNSIRWYWGWDYVFQSGYLVYHQVLHSIRIRLNLLNFFIQLITTKVRVLLSWIPAESFSLRMWIKWDK